MKAFFLLQVPRQNPSTGRAGYRYTHTDWQWLETGDHINNITWNPGEPTYNVKPSEDFLRLLPGAFGDGYSLRQKPLPMICEYQILFKK